MDKKFLALLILVSFVFIPYQTAPSEPHGRLVVVIVLDGFNPAYLPNATSLDSLARLSVPLYVTYPAVTIVNHLTFVTGMYPNETNIPNTYVYDPNKLRSDWTSPSDAELSRSDILASENLTTLYTVAGEKGYLTALVTAKSKLLALLGTNGKATVLDKYPGYVDYDNLTNQMYINERAMNETKRIVESRIDKIVDGERGYILVNLPGTDYIGHNYGPFSPEYAQVALQEISLVYEFITRLKSTPIRSRSLVIVCGDHSMAPVSENVATEDTVTHALIIPELAVAGVTHVGIGTSGNGVLLYLLNNDTNTIEKAVQTLRNTGKVDGVRTSVYVDGANGTLKDIGLDTPYAGDIFVSLKPPYYFADGTLHGAHGGYYTEVTHARVFSGRDVIKNVDHITSIDVAAMSFGFLGLEPIGHGNASRVLDEKVLSSVSAEMPPFVESGSTFYISIFYSLPSGTSGEVKVTVYDSNGNEVTSKSVNVSGSGSVRVGLTLNEGSYKVIVSLLVNGEEVAGHVYYINVQKPASANVVQPVAKMAVTLVLFIAIIAASIYIAKRIKRFFNA